MLFHEIYGAYYNAVAAILREAVHGELDAGVMKQICDEKAFSESFLEIIPSLRNGDWQLLRSDFTTPLKNEPTQPLSLLQKRWLKAVSLDPRVKLFGLDWGFVEDVQPLFTPDDIVVFDRYNDGDSYEDEHYITVFRTLLAAIKSGSAVSVAYNSSKGSFRRFLCKPLLLEYSEKDDKFRVKVTGCRSISMINLAGIEAVSLTECRHISSRPAAASTPCVMEAELIDQRNALERAMLHFAHFEKETSRLSDNRYRLKIYYDQSDESELIIRVLQFGPMLRATAPESFVDGIKQRLEMQKLRGIR